MDDRNPYAQLNEADPNNNIIHNHNPYQIESNQNINPSLNYNYSQNQPEPQYNPNQRQSFRQSVHSLPQAVGYAPNPHPIMGVPAYQNQNQGYNQNQNQNQGYNPYNNYVAPNQIPPQYRGDGYYNPDVVRVVVAPPARNRAKLCGCLFFIIFTIAMISILVTNIS